MILAIEFTAAHIHLTEYGAGQKSIVVKKFVEVSMPDGAYLNGIVVNTAAVGAAIQVAVKENQIRSRKVLMTVSGNDIIHKDFQIPSGSGKQMRGMVENELVKAGMLKSDYVFDYITKKDGHEKEQMKNAEVYLMPRALIHNYQTAIRRAGLKPYRIETAGACMERLAKLLGVDHEKDMTILCCAEKDAISLLFSGAESKMVYRSTHIEKQGSLEENAFIVSAVHSFGRERDEADVALEEIVDSVSKMVQFHSQMRLGNRVGQILLYGDLALEEGFLDKLENATGISVKLCPVPEAVRLDTVTGFSALTVLGAAASGLSRLQESKKLDFFKLLKEKKKDVVTKKELIPLAVGLGLVGVLAGVYSYQAFGNAAIEASLQKTQSFLDDPDNMAAYAEAKSKKDFTAQIRIYNESCGDYIDIIKNARRLEDEDFYQLTELMPSNVSIETYSFSNKQMSISCTTDSQDGAADFARILTDSGHYTDVKYSGFSSAKDSEGAEKYSFQLQCRLWE